MIDFTNLCRACNCKKSNLLNLFVNDCDEDDEPTLGAKYSLCTSLKLDTNDGLPQMICYSCVKLLESAYKFRKLCYKSVREIRLLIKEEQCKSYEKNANIVQNEKVLKNVKEEEEKSNSYEDSIIEETNVEYLDESFIENENYEVSHSQQINPVEEQEEIEFITEDGVSLKNQLNIKTNISQTEHLYMKQLTEVENKNSNATNENLIVLSVTNDTTDRSIFKTVTTTSSSNCNQNLNRCFYCNKTFLTRQAHLLHMKIHHNRGVNVFDKKYKKSTLKSASRNKINKIQQQQQQQSQQSKYLNECKKCYIIFYNSIDFRTHILREHTYKCKICEKSSNTQYEYKKHIRECEQKHCPFICKICGNNSINFEKHSDLLKHNLLQHNKIIYICTEDNCEGNFNSEKLLKQHLEESHGLKNK